MSSHERPPPPTRDAFPFFATITTRWADNDVYGHANNVIYYSYFDTAIAGLLVGRGALDPATSPIIGLAVENGCRFHSSIGFPDIVHAGVGVASIGNSSVRYRIGIFRNDETIAAADGTFVHVFVDRLSQRPRPIPSQIREVLEACRMD